MAEPYLKIYTDGSHCPSSHCNGYGVCLDFNGNEVVKFSGKHTGPTRNSSITELVASCHGIIHASVMLENRLRDFSEVTVVTDATTVRKYLEGSCTVGDDDIDALLVRARRIFRMMGMKIKTIKGHRPKDTSREAYLNHQCDKLAKVVMREWRDVSCPIDETFSRRRVRKVNRAKQRAEGKEVPRLWM